MPAYSAVDAHIARHVPDALAELRRLCAVPSVSARHEGVEECAQVVAGLLRDRGFDVEVLPSGGHPVVVALSAGRRPERTVLFYNHYDVQPPEPLELWHSPPFELTERDGRVYARGAKDDKGELVARLLALDALRARDGDYPCSIRFLVEGEEEVGSPNLPAFVESHWERLQANLAIWEEGGVDAEERPELALGARGLLYVELSVSTLSRDGHSGMGNLLPNAAWRLSWALASLKGPDERIRIPGFYDSVKGPDERQRRLLEQLTNPERSIKESFGLSQLLNGRTGFEVVAAPFEPTCNIAGLDSGYQGPGAKTIVPAVGRAKLDFRLVPGQEPYDIAEKLRYHLDEQGFTDVEVKVLGAERAGIVDPD